MVLKWLPESTNKGEQEMQPLHDYVFIELEQQEQKTQGGIIIPDNAKEKPTKGKIVAVGPGTFEFGQFIGMTVKPGQTVLFPKWAGSFTEIEINGKKLAAIRETDIICIL